MVKFSWYAKSVPIMFSKLAIASPICLHNLHSWHHLLPITVCNVIPDCDNHWVTIARSMMWKNRFSASNKLVASPLSQPPGTLLCTYLEWWQLKSANSSGTCSSTSNVNTKKLVAIVCRTAHIARLQQIVIEEPQSLLDIWLPLHGGGNHQLCLCLHNNYELLMQITLFPSICNTQHHAECTTIELHNCVSNHLTHLPSTSTLNTYIQACIWNFLTQQCYRSRTYQVSTACAHTKSYNHNNPVILLNSF